VSGRRYFCQLSGGSSACSNEASFYCLRYSLPELGVGSRLYFFGSATEQGARHESVFLSNPNIGSKLSAMSFAPCH
jgi:hypothetical protein